MAGKRKGQYGESANGRIRAFKLRESAAVALPDATTHAIFEYGTFREVGGTPNPDIAKVVLISAGRGSLAGKNYYTPELIAASVAQFEGVPARLNHMSRSEETDRPEGDVRNSCGWYENARVESLDGETAIVADLRFSKNAAGNEAKQLIATEREYRKKYPHRTWGADLSINAIGESHETDLGGERWNQVDRFAEIYSVDLVTRGGARGRLLEATDAATSKLPSGRLGTLTDLRQQSDAVEATHDPENIKTLISSLNAFLNAEIDEVEGKEKEPAMADKAKKPAAKESADTTAAVESTPDAGAQAAEVTEAGTMTCPECGHKMPMPSKECEGMDEKKEAATVAESTQPAAPAVAPTAEARRESAPPTEPPVSVSTLTEADRAELEVLRAEKRKAGLLVRAREAIAAADVFMEPDSLITFAESQWPTIIDFALGSQSQPTFSAAMESAADGGLPPAGRRTKVKESAADYFANEFDTATGYGLRATR